MLSLLLTGRLATTEYDAAPVYSQRRTGVVLDQILPLLPPSHIAN
ncbi:MAG: hypothetical protein OEO77_07575 [Acidimicrobiia bacterium]|nr:hypothetical protein [Acidimicrobiia bacterium]